MYQIKGYRKWKEVSKEEALEYGKNRLKALGLEPTNKRLKKEIVRVLNQHVKGIDLKEFGIYE